METRGSLERLRDIPRRWTCERTVSQNQEILMRASVVWLLSTALSAVALGAGAAGQPKPKPIWERNAPLPQGFNSGEAFPTLALSSAADGRPVSLAEFRGKKLIINIFASW
jgi:hypothetical protein